LGTSAEEQLQEVVARFFFKQLGAAPVRDGDPFPIVPRLPNGKVDKLGVSMENFAARPRDSILAGVPIEGRGWDEGCLGSHGRESPGNREIQQRFGDSLQPGGQRRNEPPSDENCLSLNVWTPAADGRKRPVMFYSQGGVVVIGSGGSAYQDGGNLARTWDVVVLATNHRLGLMGFLFLGDLGGEEYVTSGNQGLLDICDGLKWGAGEHRGVRRRQKQRDDLRGKRRRC
jgi:hypothetical protein